MLSGLPPVTGTVVLHGSATVLISEGILLTGHGVGEVAVLQQFANLLHGFAHTRQQAEYGYQHEEGSGEATEHHRQGYPTCPLRATRVVAGHPA